MRCKESTSSASVFIGRKRYTSLVYKIIRVLTNHLSDKLCFRKNALNLFIALGTTGALPDHTPGEYYRAHLINVLDTELTLTMLYRYGCRQSGAMPEYGKTLKSLFLEHL